MYKSTKPLDTFTSDDSKPGCGRVTASFGFQEENEFFTEDLHLNRVCAIWVEPDGEIRVVTSATIARDNIDLFLAGCDAYARAAEYIRQLSAKGY